jgi:hypothetical protein
VKIARQLIIALLNVSVWKKNNKVRILAGEGDLMVYPHEEEMLKLKIFDLLRISLASWILGKRLYKITFRNSLEMAINTDRKAVIDLLNTPIEKVK